MSGELLPVVGWQVAIVVAFGVCVVGNVGYVVLMWWAARVRQRRWSHGLYSLNDLADRNEDETN